ncbi:XRE family transcriptional regulator [Bacillus thuringiensis]|uniref:XRE family transcriptional regulator n=4 Tax=Bacillus cereus group TaxID=86661 RepID=A0A9X7AZ99_BACTU|nr:Transcriptional regulator, XRE [Bacillus thuringiensis serovar pakistani str. T13001]PFT89344.1 XRE family transcriptional regulator [Bacillus thuringiensis]
MNMFGQRLKDLRREKKLTQQDIADVLGIEKSNISRFESGKQSLSSENIIKTAKYFDVSVDYILGISDYKTINKKKEEQIPKDVVKLIKKINTLSPEKRQLIESLIDNF